MAAPTTASSDSETKHVCAMHVVPGTTSDFLRFSEKSWSKYISCAERWVKLVDREEHKVAQNAGEVLGVEFDSSAVRTVDYRFPDAESKNMHIGFHSDCRRRFCDVSKIDLAEQGVERAAQKRTATASTSTGIPSSRWASTEKTEAMPPNQDSLKQHIMRANYQAAVYKSALDLFPDIPSPHGRGWIVDGESIAIHWTDLAPAPDSILEFVHCDCKKTKCIQGGCSCLEKGLPCTDLCKCVSCENTPQECLTNDGDDNDEDDDSDSESED
ncbi:uncharacterized protein [Amphiura filiformis]|uniref:uncharacterized protein isoform X1 n=1 Tax=Amphiura filiformis TaxID=82378 RepID=UPI003B21E334